MGQVMTWGEFKRTVEERGVSDNDLINRISVNGLHAIRVERDVRDRSVNVLSPRA